MYKVIVYDQNLEVVKNFCNSIFHNFSELKLAGIANTKRELAFLCKNSKPDVILFSNDNYCDNSIYNIVNLVEFKVIFCEEPKKFKNSKYVLHISSDSKDVQNFRALKKFFTRVDEKTIRQKVRKILESLNCDFKLIGTYYLIESIIYCYLNKDDYLVENLEKNVYPFVAKKCQVSAKSVKWAIIRSVNNMNQNLKKSNKTFFNTSEKITSKLLISEIVNHL